MVPGALVACRLQRRLGGPLREPGAGTEEFPSNADVKPAFEQALAAGDAERVKELIRSNEKAVHENEFPRSLGRRRALGSRKAAGPSMQRASAMSRARRFAPVSLL
jgi:hypothetical protein